MAVKKNVRKMADNVKDSIGEAKHRTKAGLERGKRDVGRNEMTAGEKMKSTVKEGGERVAAGVDRAKREIRKNT